MTFAAAQKLASSGTPEEIVKLGDALKLMGFAGVVAQAKEDIIEKAAEVKRLAAAFLAHHMVSNGGAMESVLNQLRHTELQDGLIRHFGGIGEWTNFLSYAHRAIALAKEAKAKKKVAKKRRTEAA